jgi:Leucine-rich repeat (LRR) protein
MSFETQTQELRLNGNKILSIPDTIHLNPHIKILDLGKNLIKEWRCAHAFSPFSCALGLSAVGPQKLTLSALPPWCHYCAGPLTYSDVEKLAKLPKLKSLTLAGNPLAEESVYRDSVRRPLPPTSPLSLSLCPFSSVRGPYPIDLLTDLDHAAQFEDP